MDEGIIRVDIGDPLSFLEIPDAELEGLIMMSINEQKRRALAEGDINALTEEAFEKGFLSNGLPRDPWMRNGLLVCMGSRIDKSGTSHVCGFAHIGESWVWESEDKIHDTIRNIPGPKSQMRSATIVGAYEGMELDLITCRTRGGIHEMVSNKSFTIKNGELTVVTVRTPKARNHR